MWWWWWLLLVDLLVGLLVVECLKHGLYQLILCSNELLWLLVVVGFVGLVVAGLAIALVVPCLHHLIIF
jgi:hypothetical protein